jgi:predicted transcriptional regulator
LTSPHKIGEPIIIAKMEDRAMGKRGAKKREGMTSVNIAMPIALKAELDALAEAEDRSFTRTCERLLREALDARSKPVPLEDEAIKEWLRKQRVFSKDAAEEWLRKQRAAATAANDAICDAMVYKPGER